MNPNIYWNFQIRISVPLDFVHRINITSFELIWHFYQVPIGEKKTEKSEQFFCGDQYISPTNNFTRLKLTPTKSFYQLFFLLNKNHDKNQITEILKKIYQIYYIIIWLSGAGSGRVVKKEKFTAADQSKLVSYTDSSSEEEEDLTLTLILMNQLILIFCF